MPKVFISHSWDDNDISRRLAEQLKRDGAEIWIDYAKISGGDSLPDRISEALDWCDTLVLIWSESAAVSYYVKLEWQAALDLQKRIIPCMVDDIPRPAILRSFLYIPFIDVNSSYTALVRALELPTPKQLAQPIWQVDSKFSKPLLPRSIYRSKPRKMSDEDVSKMLKKYEFYDSKMNKHGKGVGHRYAKQTIGKDEVVVDAATSLMWQQGVSTDYMDKAGADEWIRLLNIKGHAGFNDWRLPTLEEAMNLMEPFQKYGDLYINPVFDKPQQRIWTHDKIKGEPGAWVISFYSGYCCISTLLSNSCHVRAVRSINSSAE